MVAAQVQADGNPDMADLYRFMPVAAFSVTRAGEVTRCNDALLNFLGVVRIEDVVDERLNGLIAGLAHLQQVSGSTVPEYRDSHIVDTRDGKRHVAVLARSGSGPDRPVMDVYLTDVTEQELQARRATEAENNLREIYDNVPVMMLSLDVTMRIVETNRMFLDSVGRRGDELIGRSLARLLAPGADRAELARSVARLQRGEVVREVPIELLHADGRTMEALYTASPHVDASGMVVGINAMLLDVTSRNQTQRERDELQAQLQLSRKLDSIGELAAGIAHEINTPAQYVGDNLSFLSEGFGDVDTLLAEVESATQGTQGNDTLDKLAAATVEADVEYLREEIPSSLRQAQEGIGKIREIVLALKDFSHPGSGVPEPADINRIVESTVTVARNEWKYVADLELDLDADLPPVYCLPSTLGQVVLNIVVNAAHAIGDADSTSRGQIHVTTRQLDEHNVAIVIADNGPGVPEKIRDKVFDPFFTTKEVGRGTGQGLAISRRVIVEQHAGQLLIEDTPGGGATFRIVLPIRGSDDSRAAGAVA